LLRLKVERAEREKREMQMRLSQSSQGGIAAFNAQEMQRQLETVRQQLAFREQEVDHRLLGYLVRAWLKVVSFHEVRQRQVLC
jgi:hypothetical protein